jgi:hypothetical protein
MSEKIDYPRPGDATAADHVVLRALVKYMSRVLGITYKELADAADTNESAVKNYANDKSTTAPRAAQTYTALFGASARLVAGKLGAAPGPFLVGALTHLFGEAWVRSRGIRMSGAGSPEEPADRALARWARVSQRRTEEVEFRYRGLWRVVRASTDAGVAGRAGRFELTDINCALLNIRPRTVGRRSLCDFQLFYLGRDRRPHERQVFEGFVIPTGDRLEFLARAQNRSNLLTLMVWHFQSDPKAEGHAAVSDGLTLALNTLGRPLAARVCAFFVPGSERAAGDDFEALREAELEKVRVRALGESGGVIPADRLEETVRYLSEYRPVVGFTANEGDAGDD